MKNKTYSAIISILFIVSSLGIIIPTYFVSDFYSKSLILNLGYSLFGGSLLAVAINIIDYLSIKKKTINNFYDECFEFIKLLNKIEFTYIGERELIIAEYLFSKEFIGLDKNVKDGFIQRAVKAFNEQGWNIGSNDVLACIENESKSFEEKITKSMISYIELSNYLINRMIKLSNDIYFFSPLMRKHHKENEELLNMANDVIRMSASPSQHFSYFLKKEMSNIFAVTKFLEDLNNYIFKIKKINNGVVVWKEKMNSFNELLNKFICAVNHKKYAKQEYPPFFEFYSIFK